MQQRGLVAGEGGWVRKLLAVGFVTTL